MTAEPFGPPDSDPVAGTAIASYLRPMLADLRDRGMDVRRIILPTHDFYDLLASGQMVDRPASDGSRITSLDGCYVTWRLGVPRGSWQIEYDEP